MKMYILIIQDNFGQYSLGKIIVHCCHNASRTEMECYLRNEPRWREWLAQDETKILLWVKNLDTLRDLCLVASQMKIPSTITEDAGVKETLKGTVLGGAIGPISEEEAAKIGLKKLPLFKMKGDML